MICTHEFVPHFEAGLTAPMNHVCKRCGLVATPGSPVANSIETKFVPVEGTVEKTGNEIECEKIVQMSGGDLLDYVIEFPEYLTDGYYREFGDAIGRRHKQLRGRA